MKQLILSKRCVQTNTAPKLWIIGRQKLLTNPLPLIAKFSILFIIFIITTTFYYELKGNVTVKNEKFNFVTAQQVDRKI